MPDSTTAVAEARAALVAALPSWPEGFSAVLDAYEAAARAPRCESETFIRDDQHVVVSCEFPAGHMGAHLGHNPWGFGVEWSDGLMRDGVASAEELHENPQPSLVQNGRESASERPQADLQAIEAAYDKGLEEGRYLEGRESPTQDAPSG